MASSGEGEVRVPIGIPVETNAAAAADDVGSLRDQIAKSRDVIKLASENLRNLRGSSAEVTAAKDQLRSAMNKEKEAVSAATLKLVKHGTSYDKLAAQVQMAKKAEVDSVKALSGAVSRMGGPIGRLSEGLASLKEMAAAAGGSGGLGYAALGATGLAVAAVAAVAGVGMLAGALARWAIKGADAARSMQLLREASTSSATNATNLGTQIDALAKKVPTSTEELNKLGASLARSRLGGQQTVDLLNAIAQANAALGDESLGGKMKEIVERGRLAQRMYLGLYELQGTGLDFDEVATALADSMHVGVAKAKQALLEGKVSLSDGTRALKDAVEKKFGGINLRKLMSIDGLMEMASKLGHALTKGINLDRAGQSVFKFLHAFDETTVTGFVLKRAVTAFGNGIVTVLERGGPIATAFLKGMIVGGLEMYVAYLQVKNVLSKTFGGDVFKNVDAMKLAIDGGRIAIVALVGAVAVLGGALAVAGAVIALPFLFMYKVCDLARSALDGLRITAQKFTDIDWRSSGIAIVEGLIGGLADGEKKVVDAITGLAGRMKKAFTDKLMIRSPSKAFRLEARQVPAGVKKGVEDGTPDARRAVENMVKPQPMPEPRSAFRGAGAAGGGGAPTPVAMNITVVLQGGPGAPSATEQVQDPGLLAAATKMLKDAAGAAGIVVANAV